MNAFDAMSTRLVLQGEVSVYQGNDIANIKLHTSVPTTCTVLTLHNEEKKIAIMAHVDDYMSVEHLFYSINEQIKCKFNCPLQSLKFQAKIIGGTEEVFSQKQQQRVISLLKVNNIAYEKLSTEKERPQVVLSASNGEVKLLYGHEKNYRLEFLQQREYSAFNHLFLDREYDGVKGEDIPDFEAIQAKRTMYSLPKFNMPDVSEKSIDAALHLEDLGQLRLPLVSWKRTAVISKEKAFHALEKLVKDSNKENLSKAFQSKDYNLLLRQACNDPQYDSLMNYLLKSRFPLEIDITAEGKTSGSPLKIAKKVKNLKAVTLLEKLME